MSVSSNGLKFSSILVASFAMVACGGGGSSTTPTAVSGQSTGAAPAPSPAPAPAPPTGSAPAETGKNGATLETLASTSNAAKVLGFVNASLANCGLTELTPIAELSAAARNHGAYVATNGIATGSAELSNRAGYSGADARAQADAAGYTRSVSVAQAGLYGRVAPTFDAISAASTRLYTPHSQLALTSGALHFGYADGADFGQILVLGSGAPAVPVRGSVATFPCEGSTGVSTAMDAAGINVSATRTLDQQVLNPFGPALRIYFNPLDDVSVQALTYTNLSTFASLGTEQAKYTGLGHANLLSTWLPFKRLAPMTSYLVEIRLSVNLQTVRKSFTIITGKD